VAVLGMARRCFDGRSLTSSRHMQRLETRLDGPVLLAPTVHGDERGFFVETFRADVAAAHGIPADFVQDNHSRSRQGTLRGIHFQTHPGQGKLVRVARGEVFDVVVDLRRGSPTFGEWESAELTDANARQVYIPNGFAHGFCVTSELADVTYKVTAYYDTLAEAGIAYDDPEIGVCWPDIELRVSDRDSASPRLADVAESLPFDY
jgi:dTDP-4-dehydrorhamnose 3,5-epimerase